MPGFRGDTRPFGAGAPALISCDWGGTMDKQDVERLATLLQEIREGQREQLSIQREHFELAKTQYDRANAINDRAERIQAKSDALMDRSGRVFKLVIPILVVLVAAAAWLLFRII